MLDLSVSTREVSGVYLAADTEDPTQFFVLPPAPTLAMKNGAPAIQLLRLIQDGALSGGNLNLVVQLQHPPALLDRVREEIAAQLKRTPVALSPIPLKEATADLQFVGREPTSDGGLTSPLRRSFLRTSPALDPPHKANFSISLTPDGVRLVEAALRSGGAPIGACFLLTIEGLWPAQRVLARIDWGRVYDHFSMNVKEGYLLSTTDILKITEDLIQSQAISIQVVRGLAEPPGSDDGTAAALAWIQRDLVERFCEPVLPLNREPAHASLGTFGEMFGVGSSFVAKKLTQIERAVAQVDFQQQRVVTRTIVSQAHLLDLLAGADPSQHIADAGLDHPFFQRMSLNVRSAQRLEALNLKEVVVDVTYGTAQSALRLTPDLPEAHFESWADASPDRSWSVQTEITFSDDAPLDPGERVSLDQLKGDLRELTLDLRQMAGLVRTTVKPGVDTRIALSQVHFTHSRGDNLVGETDLAIAPKAPDTWAWFRNFQPGDQITANVRYLLTDGRIVTVPPLPVDTEILRLPPAFPGVLTVQIISDDDWTGLDRVTVALQKHPDSATGTFVFDKPSQVVAVNLDMPDPTDRMFRYRMTRTLATGVEEADDWIETDVAIIIAGRVSANRLIVDVSPIGPELPQAGIRLIEVELSYLDPEHQVRDQKTVAIAARTDHPRWEVAIQDPSKRTYEYRATVYPLNGGAPHIGHWIKSTDRILAVPIVTIN